MNKPILLLIIIFSFLFNEKVFGTAQFPDILIDGKDTVAIFSNSFEQYLSNKENRIFCGEKLEGTSTACYRGYLAIWMIRDNKLYLKKVLRGCGEIHEKEFNLKKEFGSNEVFANWFTGKIVSPRGRLLQYMHAGYSSIYEKEKKIYITDGIIDSIITQNFLMYDDNLLNPIKRHLHDTLRTIIMNNLEPNKIKNFSDSSSCSIEISFNSDGLIDSIYNRFTHDGISFMEDYILSVADTSFKNLPRLMKVKHEQYHPPTISIKFDADCFKNPCKYKCYGYGCDNKRSKSHSVIMWIVMIIIIDIGIGIVILSRRIKRR